MKLLLCFVLITLFIQAENIKSLYIRELTVSQKKENSKNWDLLGKPDIQMKFFVKIKGAWQQISKSKVFKNTHTLKDKMFKLSVKEKQQLRIDVSDHDAVDGNDFIGSYEVTIFQYQEDQVSFGSVQKFNFVISDPEAKNYLASKEMESWEKRLQKKEQELRSLENRLNFENSQVAKTNRLIKQLKEDLAYWKKEFEKKEIEKNELQQRYYILEERLKQQKQYVPKTKPQELPAFVQFDLEKVTKALDEVEEALQKKYKYYLKSARISMDSAQYYFDNVQKAHRGKFNEKQPKFMSIVNRLHRLNQQLKKEESLPKENTKDHRK
ncbi:C2 domain-containing protein [Candidatus Uabimicrobium amorphum]|uniref:C2 domain-containing protein n=1 Tax=Uabimicrobium amorphum TaxID=2596890 RepID=A0A5S9IJP7_UABAM|nr:C2 domain-containing protein [Candidatus Uabimicrobium amorphum]BBM82631.1 hypothetical protein UABAM_00974 [Candidatus Uabimicrobium amorphum]